MISTPMTRDHTIETDYLVVGAGAAGMAFTDALVAASDAEVVLVDRHHRPGGHWNDDYAFVQLHQPSAYYGVSSRTLGSDRLDQTGHNAGFYERAMAAEVSDYFNRVLEQDLLPTGRVRFCGMHDYVGEEPAGHQFISRITGQVTTVTVRRALVDATYLAASIPSQHQRPFTVEDGAQVISPNELVNRDRPASGFTVIGAGKTAMDTVSWLLDQGVAPDTIRWVRPRDAWTVDRTWTQPLTLLDSFAEWLARQYEAAAQAQDINDLIARFEEAALIIRLDPDVEPTVFRGATLSERERTAMRSVTDVVRMGRVQRVGLNKVELEQGTIHTDPAQVHIDCTAAGLGFPPVKPVFEPGRITIQRVQAGVDPFSAAMIGHVEAVKTDDAEKNRLCEPLNMTGDAHDLAIGLGLDLRARAAWMADADVQRWWSTTRLNPFRGAGEHLTDKGRESARRMLANMGPAMENMQRVLADLES